MPSGYMVNDSRSGADPGPRVPVRCSVSHLWSSHSVSIEVANVLFVNKTLEHAEKEKRN